MTRSFDVYLIRAWINGWVKNREAIDLRRHHANCDVPVMWLTGSVCLRPVRLINHNGSSMSSIRWAPCCPLGLRGVEIGDTFWIDITISEYIMHQNLQEVIWFSETLYIFADQMAFSKMAFEIPLIITIVQVPIREHHIWGGDTCIKFVPCNWTRRTKTWPLDCPYIRTVMRKAFPCQGVIMTKLCIYSMANTLHLPRPYHSKLGYFPSVPLGSRNCPDHLFTKIDVYWSLATTSIFRSTKNHTWQCAGRAFRSSQQN